jgi:TRAP-type C4-dicarboxylate transport system permease small subunit
MAWRVRFQTFASLELSMTWAYAAIPVGAAFSSIALVANFLVQPNVGSSKGELEDMSCQE